MDEQVEMLTGITCAVCEHDVPVSEAIVFEAVDYVIHFCGLDCYARWRSQQGRQAGS